jgi:hypothetical protein
MTPEELRTRGFGALRRELGPVGFIKFMHQFNRGRGDYTKERHALLAGWDVDKIVREIKTHREG